MEISRLFHNRNQPRNAVLVALFATAIFASRRPAQIAYPAIWVEDGTRHIPEYFLYGVQSILHPTNGYSQVIGRAITAISLELFGSYYAYGSTVLTAAAFFAISWLIARQASYLPAVWALPLIAAALPIDPEPVLLPSYLFWYAGICAFTTPFLNLSKVRIWEILALALTACSSPFSAVAIPPLFAATLIDKGKQHAKKARLLLLISFASVLCTMKIFPSAFRESDPSSLATSPQWHLINKDLILDNVFKLVSFSPTLQDGPGKLLLFSIVGFAYIAGFSAIRKHLQREGKTWHLYVLLYFWISSISITVMRVGYMDSIDPVVAGPRYFFYPYLISLYLVVVATIFSLRRFDSRPVNKELMYTPRAHLLFRDLCIAILSFIGLASVLGLTFKRFYRASEHLGYFPSESISRCADTPGGAFISVAFTGDEEKPWVANLSQSQCIFLNRKPLAYAVDLIRYGFLRQNKIIPLLPSAVGLNPKDSLRCKASKTCKVAIRKLAKGYEGIYYRGGGFRFGQFAQVRSPNQTCNSSLKNIEFLLPSTGNRTSYLPISPLPSSCTSSQLLLTILDRSKTSSGWSEILNVSEFK